MSSDELRAARERVRQAGHVGNATIADRNLIVENDLREHRPDDGEAIDEDWLRSVGFESVEYERVLGTRRHQQVQKLTRFQIGEDPLSLSIYEDEWKAMLGGLSFPDQGCELPDQKTRGELRDLCRVLKIPLKEQST